MILHEYYFDVFGPNDINDIHSDLLNDFNTWFGSYDSWKTNFYKTGEIPGVGFVVLYKDKITGRLINTWITDFNSGELINGKVLLVMDLCQFGLNLTNYFDAFFLNINWKIVNDRYIL